MVGTNPASGSATTTIPTEILPLKVVMANGVVQKIITAHSFSAKTLLLILSGSTFLYLGDPSACCIYGFHGSYNAADGVGTYAVSDWIAPTRAGACPQVRCLCWGLVRS
jgi:hypothetical protein